jgi:hypothetical protein
MLRHIVRTLIAAVSLIPARENSKFPPRVVMRRPVWENGTNYDIPTYLRRKAIQATARTPRAPSLETMRSKTMSALVEIGIPCPQ